jgi:AcrR family transcriptional regulator
MMSAVAIRLIGRYDLVCANEVTDELGGDSSRVFAPAGSSRRLPAGPGLRQSGNPHAERPLRQHAQRIDERPFTASRECSLMPKTEPAQRPRSRARYEARRQEIVDIAAHVFAQRGYHATSIEDLVAATGLQRGGLYHYIGSKEELLIRIHERFIEPLLAEAHAIEAQGEDASATLRALARALMSDIAEYRDQVTVFLHEWKTLGNTRDGQRAKKVMTARKEFEAVIDRTLSRGVDDGLFDIADRRLAVLGFLGMINYTYQWYSSRGPFAATAIADAFCTYFLRGIEKRAV